MSGAHEFHYRLPRRVSGWRPGAHPGSSLGGGQEFVSHMSLYDRPDPRRLDLRASLRSLRGDWLVRVNRQRASVAVHVVADVSASMRFGSAAQKIEVAADFVEALSRSAYRSGDSLGMAAFDREERRDLFVPALVSRGMGSVMASLLRESQGAAGGIEGLEEVVQHLAGREGLIFIVSDFHWPLDRLGAALDLLAHAYVVPIIVWDPAETQPPERDSLAIVRDSETGAGRALWVRPKLRVQWLESVAQRRAELGELLAARHIRPFYVEGGTFDSEAMSKYFFEAAT
ncbi:MAG: MxaS protein [Gammaproteobacteria bacterium]